MKDSLHLQIKRIAEEYFAYLAKSFPVMCLSDEFYFFPRARKATRFLNMLDSLDKDKIKQDISYIKNLKNSLEGLDSKDIDLETQIDLTLLKQSMATFLREFDHTRIWQVDPSLYLKIALLGINQLFIRFSFIKADIDDYLQDRISQIPRLLHEAKSNLEKVPAAYLEVAIEMVGASIDYLREVNISAKRPIESLEDFKRFLIKRSSDTTFIKDRKLIEVILKDSFSYDSDLEEIFEIASREYRETLKQLAQIAREIESGRTWQQLLSVYRIEANDREGLLGLYSGEIKRIEDFIKEKDIITITKTQDILVRFTPRFMKPIRASASYSSPVTDDKRESAYFYITADYEKRGTISNLHNEYIFVTAHETYPGHHLLDSVRRYLTNPIRQQIESPLFYEGWASYAERLIDQLGYIKDPVHKMLGLRRQAWRAIRAMLDVGIRINKLKVEDAEYLLRDLGYASGIVRSMARHYVLLPGYQLCYTIGKFEIDKLKERFSSRLGLKRFHDLLLEGGQVPFDLIARKMSGVSDPEFPRPQ